MIRGRYRVSASSVAMAGLVFGLSASSALAQAWNQWNTGTSGDYTNNAKWALGHFASPTEIANFRSGTYTVNLPATYDITNDMVVTADAGTTVTTLDIPVGRTLTCLGVHYNNLYAPRSMTITGGGTLDLVNNAQIQPQHNDDAYVTVDGATVLAGSITGRNKGGFLLTNNAVVTLTSAILTPYDGSGTFYLYVRDGSTLTCQEVYIPSYVGNTTATGVVEVSGGSTLIGRNRFKIGAADAPNKGTGSCLVTGAGTVLSNVDSHIYIAARDLAAFPGEGAGGSLTIDDGATVYAHGIYMFSNATLFVDGGSTLKIKSLLWIYDGAWFGGTGTVTTMGGNLDFDMRGGTIAPGGTNRVGAITFTGNVYVDIRPGEPSGDNAMEFELESPSSYDTIHIGRTMDFDKDGNGDGDMDVTVTILENCVPAVSDTFDLITVQDAMYNTDHLPTLTIVNANPAIISVSGSLSMFDSNKRMRLTITDVELAPTGTVITIR